jgi:hypothetical protein
MVEKDHPGLSVAAQCRLPSIPRSTFHHRPVDERAENLALMRMVDRQFMETPFYGGRQMTWHLRNDGHAMNPKRVRRLMRLMVKGTVALAGPRKPRNDAHLPKAEHQQAGQRPPAVPVPAPRPDDRPTEPGLMYRHYVDLNPNFPPASGKVLGLMRCIPSLDRLGLEFPASCSASLLWTAWA